MQAELCGLALAVAPNEACYVPLGHRQGGEGEAGGLFRRRARARPDCPKRAALDALKPLLEDRGVLKIGHDLKFAWQIFALRGIAMAGLRRHHADVVCARRRPRRATALRSLWPSAPSITPRSTSTS